MQNATTRRRLTELLPITITWGEIFVDALSSRSLQDPCCPSITNISTSSFMWSAVIYCNKKSWYLPPFFSPYQKLQIYVTKNAGSVWPSVQLTVEPGKRGETGWRVWASCTGAQGHRRKAGIGQTTYRRSGHTDNLLRFCLVLVLEWLSLDITSLWLILFAAKLDSTKWKREILT